MPEFLILDNVIDCMEENGTTYKLVHVTIDEELLNEINGSSKEQFNLEQLQKAADKCLAHEWLKHTFLGDKYHHLQIIPKGIGAARSKKRAQELKASRGLLKKLSDYIEDHNGLFVVLGSLLALATFALKIMGDK